MTPDHLTVEIVTPTSLTEERQVDYLRAPSTDGLFGVMPGHVPSLIALDIGELTVEQQGRREHYAISGGYAEIHREKVVLLVETAETAGTIDTDRAISALKRAKERLEKSDKSDIDTGRAKSALRRAQNRLTVARRK
ncbi:MAG: ATP synthase epsilon chain [Candidatus Marinimicrobia bacterium]|nr:ATP synthase epsilon chain [Candidatus Neomarinimicrobiota bacterium]